MALDPRRRGRAVDAGLPGRRAAVRHQHGGAGTRALARVRRPQRERPPRLPPLRAEEPRDRSPRRRREPRSLHPLQAALRQPSDRPAARPPRHDHAAPGHLGLPGDGRSRPVVALEVPRPQPDRHGRHRRRPLPRALAGPRSPAGDDGADPQLRLGADDARVGLGAVLVRPQPAPVRPGPGRPPRRRGRLVPPPRQGPSPRHRARAEPPRPALRPRPHRPHRPARVGVRGQGPPGDRPQDPRHVRRARGAPGRRGPGPPRAGRPRPPDRPRSPRGRPTEVPRDRDHPVSGLTFRRGRGAGHGPSGGREPSLVDRLHQAGQGPLGRRGPRCHRVGGDDGVIGGLRRRQARCGPLRRRRRARPGLPGPGALRAVRPDVPLHPLQPRRDRRPGHDHHQPVQPHLAGLHGRRRCSGWPPVPIAASASARRSRSR